MKINREKTNLVIFAQGRTGSTLLEWLLCSTGHFKKNGELLNQKINGVIKNPYEYIRGLAEESDNFVFHVKLEHLVECNKKPVDPEKFLQSLASVGWKVIYLRRKNKVKHAMSNLVANNRGGYHKYKDNAELFSLKVDCDNFISRVKNRIQQDHAERAALKKIDYMEVIYEDDLENSKHHQNTINRLLDRVSLSKKPVSAPLKKINTQSLADLVTNYDEFLNAMIAQGWQRHLD